MITIVIKLKKSKWKITWTNFISFLFYILFLCPILSPSIGGMSAYLFLIVPFFDINYLKDIINKKQNIKYWNSILILILASLFYLNLLFLFKIIAIIITVTYVLYTIKKDICYLNEMVLLNVIVAIVQFISYKFFAMELLSPRNIIHFLYGKYGLNTGTNFAGGNVLLGLRVSGLSREPGFFNSLLIASSLLSKELNNKNFKMKIVYFIGIIISLSKIGLSFYLIYFLTLYIKKYIEKLSVIMISILILIIMIISVNYLYSVYNPIYLPSSILHRTIGYSVITKLNIKDYLFGVGFRNIVKKAQQIPLIKYDQFYYKMPEVILDNSGLATVVIDHGILFCFLLLTILKIYKLDSYKFLLFIAMTINVNPFTTSSFVLIGYVYLFYRPKLINNI